MISNPSYCFLGIITICFLFCLLSLPNTFASRPQFLCRRDQRDALLELKEEFPNHSNDNGYVTTVSWNKSVDCCSWNGVRCDATSGDVTLLEISSTTANTSLKPSSGLFKLHHLRELHLSYCNLQGEIPSSIGNLSQLTDLDLSFNQLVGEVPASIGNLNQLITMRLSGNKLRGNIPTSFANLTKLSKLHLDKNQLTGGDIFLANLTSLTFFQLSSNHFKSSIFTYISGLHNLEIFWGNDNSFVGPFPSSLLMISSLGRIFLSQNQFEGPIDFGNTSSSSILRVLDVGYNHIDGLIISESISELVNLQELDLSHNNLGGRVPRSISKLVNLYKLDLSYNKLEGQVPHCIWTSPKLDSNRSSLRSVDLSHNYFKSLGKSMELGDRPILLEFDLSSNSLQGPIPQWICKVRYFFFLDLSNNYLTGSIPQCLKNSTYMKKLNLQKNSLSGLLPDFCMDGTRLRSLDVSRNNLVGKLPKSLIKCKDMEFLNVRGNKINDTFPFWLGSLPRLMVLVLRSNAFYGPVYNSSAYIGFPSMRIIDISNNNFIGSLPQDYFANWTQMSVEWKAPEIREGNYFNLSANYIGGDFNVYDSINLVYKGVEMDFDQIFQGFKAIVFSENQFSGHIPGSIGLLSELRLLNLSGNAFTGNIPPSLTNITKLETLDLSRNNLSGTIPQGVGKLSSLSYVNFSHNHLEGLVPQSTQFGTQKCSSFIDNNGLYGLEEICGESHVPVPISQQSEEPLSEPEEPVLNWIAAAIAFGPGVFCGLVIGHIFTSYKHKWFIR